jgi:nucleoid-associated protein YgaU
MRLAENTFMRAHSRYTWAGSVGAANRYPSEYRTATGAYNEAVQSRQAENWEDVSDASNRVLAALVNVRGRNGETGPDSGYIVYKTSERVPGALPAQYTVRPWVDTGDCFSAIAGRSWVYGDSGQWRKLYEANKDKLPNPNNPNLILPGMIMDIPSISGETRSGMWDPEAKY